MTPAAPAAPPVLLRTRDLVKDYHADGGVVRAVRGVSLEVDAGEFVAIMGSHRRAACPNIQYIHVMYAC